MRGIATYVCDHWDEPDVGIWELRGEPRHVVHSKVMCWAAVDRAVELAEREGYDAPLDEWRECRESIKEAVLEHGFDEELNSFTRAFEGSTMDATALLIPVMGFLPPDDPRIEGTIDAVMEHLTTDDGLVYRYEDDDLPGEEGAFVLCSFWLVDALTIVGRTDEAWEVFESLLEYASPLGLFAEEIDPETGEFLGNFPQGFSHLGLLNSALYLREAEYDWATAGPLGTPTLVQEDRHGEETTD
jgi:GH15 family glucan-1,4-alpha-glucosidase